MRLLASSWLRASSALLALLLMAAPRVAAHSLTVSVLDIEQSESGDFTTHWSRVAGVSDARAAFLVLQPLFPEHCQLTGARLRCGERGLEGRLGFAGLGRVSGSAIVHVRFQNGQEQSFTFSSAQPRAWVTGPERSHGITRALRFVWIGMEHIWLGWDHLLFVLGLCWLVRTTRMLVQTITAFTLAHSVTLGAAMLGFQQLPAAPVEAVIALSIAFVAVEIARLERQRTVSLTQQRPWFVALTFGLLHGFGFANALSELSLSKSEIPLALAFFNLGVELGQLAFVAVLLVVQRALARCSHPLRTRLATAGYYALGSTAMYWFCERIAAFS